MEVCDASLPLRVESNSREADYVFVGVLSAVGFTLLGFCLVVYFQPITIVWYFRRRPILGLGRGFWFWFVLFGWMQQAFALDFASG